MVTTTNYTGPNYGPKEGMAYTAVMPQEGFQYTYDQDGRRFVPYSKSYSDEKGKTKVDLQDTNRMLQSITARPEGKNKVKLFFRSQREANKALFHQKGLGNLPERKFFGFSRANEKAIQREFAKFIKKQMKNFKI